MHAFVTSRVDYCNSLLNGLPTSQLNKVQRELHWLPLKQRIHSSSIFRTKVTLGDRSFQMAALKLWSALPRKLRDIANLHTFESNLTLTSGIDLVSKNLLAICFRKFSKKGLKKTAIRKV